MKKTHEKSRIYTVTGTAKLKNPEKVVLQIEATGQRNTDGFIYLVESVDAEDYDRTTAEGRAAAAEKELKKKHWKNYWNRRETWAAIIEGNLTKRHRKTPNFARPL